MYEDIRKLNTNFKLQRAKIEARKTRLLKSVSEMRIQYRIKIYYVNQVNTWYNTILQQLVEKYTLLLKEIQDKYEAQQFQDQSTQTSNQPSADTTNQPSADTTNQPSADTTNQPSADTTDQPSADTADTTNKKSAVLIGINYTNTENELYGCVNDAMNLKNLLKTKYNYKEEYIKTILNEEATRKTILQEITALVKEASKGDSLFLSYSGHGISADDRNGDEEDGKDELLVTSDNYGIFDDDLKQILDTHLQEGVQLFALFDNCHSGTILDLPYQYLKKTDESDKKDKDNNPVIIHSKTTETNGDVVCISGCRDDQVSMDAYINFEYTGAMTRSFIDTLTRYQEEDMSWKSLLENMRSSLKSRNFEQVPQLTSGKKIDMSKTNVNL